MQKGGWVYILTNKHHTVLYTGVTSNLVGRMQEHTSNDYPSSFTARYNTSKLVYYFLYESIGEAILEEKRIKAGSRAAKLKLIRLCNPRWDDLWLTDVCKW
jgi:putative endonuclease